MYMKLFSSAKVCNKYDNYISSAIDGFYGIKKEYKWTKCLIIEFGATNGHT